VLFRSLSERGVADTAQRVESFRSVPYRKVVSSSLVRARTFGEGLASARGVELEVTAALAEIQRGEWAGQSIPKLYETEPDRVRAYFDDPWNFQLAGAENDRDVFLRAWPVIERNVHAVRGGVLAVTSHYNVIRVLVGYLLGLAPRDSFRVRVDLSSAVALRDEPGGWRLLRSNVRAPDTGP
jgi:broad specificity phosphatase PhoE